MQGGQASVKKRSIWMIVKIAKGNRKNDYLRYPNSLTF
ncbi:hypothetical protein A343_1669 [Porphyromonas gingivalis JCVI SC001]|nr:hypothetical protein A343_1669 [Porphyromonas gingivalis JCVI SC001]